METINESLASLYEIIVSKLLNKVPSKEIEIHITKCIESINILEDPTIKLYNMIVDSFLPYDYIDDQDEFILIDNFVSSKMKHYLISGNTELTSSTKICLNESIYYEIDYSNTNRLCQSIPLSNYGEQSIQLGKYHQSLNKDVYYVTISKKRHFELNYETYVVNKNKVPEYISENEYYVFICV